MSLNSQVLVLLSLALVVLFVNVANAEDDYYKILGVSRSATAGEIKKAFRKLSKKYHPDKPTGDQAKFQEITEAYTVLSDKEKRQIYTRYGKEGLKNRGNRNHGFGGFETVFENMGFKVNFGGGSRGMRKSDDQILALEVTLEDLYLGRKLEVLRSKPRSCGTPKCDGIEETVTVFVERGKTAGDLITYEGDADEKKGYLPGTLAFRLILIPHRRYKRDGDNLELTMTISLLQALTGFEKDIPHLAGRTVKIKRTEVTKPGFVLTLKGEGMPIFEHTEYGDLIITFKVKFPKTLTDKQKAGFRALLL